MSTYRFVVILVLLSLSLCVVGCDVTKDNSDSSTVAGLKLSELPLSVVSVEGSWSEVDPLFDDTHQWRCSACVLSATDEQLILVTSSACLDLKALVSADTNAPDLGNYELKATFSGRQALQVTHIGEARQSLGISLLAIDTPMLLEGDAYLPLNNIVDGPLTVGTEVVAVIQRGNLTGTHAFGRVTALRQMAERTAMVDYIQTDLKLQAKDNGGPLFAKSNDRYLWAGINTIAMIDGEEMAFAVTAHNIDTSQFEWFHADAAGLVKMLSSIYGIDAQVE